MQRFQYRGCRKKYEKKWGYRLDHHHQVNVLIGVIVWINYVTFSYLLPQTALTTICFWMISAPGLVLPSRCLYFYAENHHIHTPPVWQWNQLNGPDHEWLTVPGLRNASQGMRSVTISASGSVPRLCTCRRVSQPTTYQILLASAAEWDREELQLMWMRPPTLHSSSSRARMPSLLSTSSMQGWLS